MRRPQLDVRHIPRVALEALEIIPAGPVLREETRVVVFCSWNPNDEARRKAASELLRTYLPDHFDVEFVQALDPNPKSLILDMIAAAYAAPEPVDSPRCLECGATVEKAIRGRSGAICDSCLANLVAASAAATDILECAMCENPIHPIRAGYRVVVCDGCLQLAAGMLRDG